MLYCNIATSEKWAPRDVGWLFQMKWFRSNIRHGARLALFAMLVQFALTFGHSHWFAQATPLALSSLQQTDNGKSIASSDRAAVQKQSPAGPDREQLKSNSVALRRHAASDQHQILRTAPDWNQDYVI